MLKKFRKKWPIILLVIGAVHVYIICVYLQVILSLVGWLPNQLLVVSKLPSEASSSVPLSLSIAERQDLCVKIHDRNMKQNVLNIEKFRNQNGTTPFFVLAIQVHDRLENLKLLIDSLSAVKGIENSLLIFSHDMFSEEMNRVIEQINFARLLQIFYPHSNQLFPYGCPPPKTPSSTKENSTTNNDDFCDCRRLLVNSENNKTDQNTPNNTQLTLAAPFQQIKNHWWWKGNFIFDQIHVIKNYSGVVGFLEEDQFASPDYLWMLSLMETAMVHNQCDGCSVLDLGIMNRYVILKARESCKQGAVTRAFSTFGLAFNRTMWESIERSSVAFCQYDDYNWDWSLKHVFRTSFRQPFHTLYSSFPRITHTGQCSGLHKKLHPTCNITSAKQHVALFLRDLHQSQVLFPSNFTVDPIISGQDRIQELYKGWDQVRDKKLCLSISKRKAS